MRCTASRNGSKESEPSSSFSRDSRSLCLSRAARGSPETFCGALTWKGVEGPWTGALAELSPSLRHAPLTCGTEGEHRRPRCGMLLRDVAERREHTLSLTGTRRDAPVTSRT